MARERDLAAHHEDPVPVVGGRLGRALHERVSDSRVSRAKACIVASESAVGVMDDREPVARPAAGR